METNVSSDTASEQVLRELKAISANLQEMKKALSDVATELHATREEVRVLPGGDKAVRGGAWINEEPKLDEERK